MNEPVVKNAKQLPAIYYGLHFYPGVAEYKELGQTDNRIFINEDIIRAMEPTFEGKPVYVRHVDVVDIVNIQQEADGYVYDSFYNKADGKHWCRFIVVSDAGHKAIKDGWKLSNAYLPTAYAQGGEWNGVSYSREVKAGTFEHLAIVPTPRYQESIILTPSEFRKYNEKHQLSMNPLMNSITKEKPLMSGLLEFFKRTKVEGDAISADTLVKLPTSGREVSLSTLINDADKAEAKEDKAPMSKEESPAEKEKQGDKPEAKDSAPQMANEEHHVQMGEGTMSVKDLKARHDKMQDCMNTLSDMASKKEDKPKMDEGEKKAESDEAPADKMAKNDDGPTLDPVEVDKFEKGFGGGKANSAHFDKLKNAPNEALKPVPSATAFEGVLLGKQLFGSGN